jgi:hypothetical protein
MTDPPKPSAEADDDPRDAHLLAALRHAPDRDVAPPARVTAAILDQAQAAARGSRARGAEPRSGWRSIWGQLWQPAPMAAFGTVAMATLIGVLWGGKELPEAEPSWRPEAVTTAPESTPTAPTVPAAAQTAAAPSPAPAAAPQATTNAAARGAAPSADKRSAAEAKSETRAEDESGRAQRLSKEKQRQAKPDADGSSEAAVTGKLVESPADQPRLAAPKAPPSPAPPPTQSPPAAIVQERMAEAPESRSDASPRSMADAVAPPSRARNEAAALGGAASTSVSPLSPAGAELDAALGRDAARVGWRTAAGRRVGHQSEQRAWWSALASATEGRWRRADAGSGGAVATADLELLIDGVPRGSLVFEPQAVIWRDASGAAWRAPVDAGTLRDWREALARW